MCPDWFSDYIASQYCPSVRPWEWNGHSAEPIPAGWRERVLVAGNALHEAEIARHPTEHLALTA